MWEVKIMTYKQAKRLWEIFGEGKYSLNSFDEFIYNLHIEDIISFNQYLKFFKKFKKEEGYK